MSASAATGVVLLPTDKVVAEHEQVVHQALGQQLARLLRGEFLGLYDERVHRGRRLYYLPTDTLIGDTLAGQQHARDLNILSHEDLFGGLVTRPFMATKAISHPLPEPAEVRPEGWCADFHEQAGKAVLAGFTVFSENDARRVGEQMLARGPIRVKQVLATAGRGQSVARTHEELNEIIAAQDFRQVQHWGLVIEEDLHDVVTYSVGQVSVAGLQISYHGTQSLTPDNQGTTVYGGSCLWIVRGGFDSLLARPMSAPVRRAVEQAIVYDRAALACLPGLIASRRNYDVAQGINALGEHCSGVLEQSWRVGGASAAEVEALLAFDTDPGLTGLRVSTHEVFGHAASVPSTARILYEGDDPQLGFLRKYIQVQPYECEQ